MTASPPTISVLMAVYNGERYLAEAIDSILAQTNPDFELIIIDDESTDSSSAIIGGYTDPRLVYLLIPHSGLVTALNHGFAHSKGRYIARMDADDRAMPERFELQVAYLDGNPTTAILCTDIYTIDSEGKRSGKQVQPVLDNILLREGLLGLRRMKPIIHPSIMMRREVLVELGGYRHFNHAEDRDLWLRAIDRFGFARLDQFLLEYRIYGGGVSRTKGREQELAGAMTSVCYLIREKTGVDIFNERPAAFSKLQDEMLMRLEKEILGPKIAFRNARTEMLSGRRLRGLVNMGRAFLRHGSIVLPTYNDKATASLVAELATRYVDSSNSV